MPTIIFHETYDRRPVSANARSGRKLTRTFEAETDDPANTSGVTVVNELGTQLTIYLGVEHPDWDTAYCTSIDPQPDSDDPGLWYITLIYEEPVTVPGTLPGVHTPSGSGPGHSQPSRPPEPADRPPMISFDTRMMDVYDTSDLDGNYYVNTAGDPLENVPARRVPMLVIKFTKWYDAYSSALAASWVNKVNLYAWEGQVADSVLIESAPAEPKTERGRIFWEVPFTMIVNPYKWIPTKLLNVGRRQLVAGNLKIIVDPTTQRELPGLSLLNAAGALTTSPHTLSFRNHVRVDFAGI